MKKLLILLMIVVIFSLFSLPTAAQEQVDGYISRFEEILPDELSGIGEDSDRLLEMASIEGLLSEIISAVSGEGGRIGGFFLTLLGSVLLTCLASLIRGELSPVVESAVGVASSLAVFSGIVPQLREIIASLSGVSEFFASLIPITVGVTALGGGVNSAAVQASGMYVSLSLIGGMAGEVLGSVALFGLALALVSSLGGGVAESVGKGVKSIFTWAIGILTALITGVFSLQTLIASSQDSLAMRTAKYLTSGLIPVVGSTVSGAISTLAAGLGYAKGIIGGGAILALLLYVIPPLVILLGYRLSVSVALTVAEISSAAATRMLKAFRSSLDMILALYALSAVIYIFEIIVFVKLGVAIL